MKSLGVFVFVLVVMEIVLKGLSGIGEMGNLVPIQFPQEDKMIFPLPNGNPKNPTQHHSALLHFLTTSTLVGKSG